MRKVVDTNFLKSPKLAEYLSEPTNIAVIPDYVIMEALAGDDPASFYKSMEILSEHPQQVVVLKPTSAVCTLKTRKRSRGLQKRLIDRGQTQGFPTFCRKMDAAKNGDKSAERQILDMRRDAAAQLDVLLGDMETYETNLQEAAKNYTPAELLILRTGQPWTQELHDKLVDNIFDLAAKMFMAFPSTELPPSTKLSNSFIFRYAVFAHLLSLKWISVGGAPGANHAKFRGDAIDANLAAFASYFDGFLTDDAKSIELHKNGCFLLKQFQQVAAGSSSSVLVQ